MRKASFFLFIEQKKTTTIQLSKRITSLYLWIETKKQRYTFSFKFLSQSRMCAFGRNKRIFLADCRWSHCECYGLMWYSIRCVCLWQDPKSKYIFTSIKKQEVAWNKPARNCIKFTWCRYCGNCFCSFNSLAVSFLACVQFCKMMR